MAETAYKTALIVGVGSGLSASLARLFAKDGMKVALAARRADNLAALAKETGAKSFCLRRDQTRRRDQAFCRCRSRLRRARRRRLQCELSHPRPVCRACPGRGREVDRGYRLRRLPGGAGGGQAHAAAKPRRDLFHRRFGEREGLCPVGAVCHGQIRAARPGAEHGARACAARHPCRAYRRSTAASAATGGPIRRTSPTACSIPTPLRRAICICCNSRAAPGPGRSSCGHGSKSFNGLKSFDGLRILMARNLTAQEVEIASRRQIAFV